MKKLSCFLLAVFIVFTGCSASKEEGEIVSNNITEAPVNTTPTPIVTQAPVVEDVTNGTVEEVQITSEAIGKNLIGQSPERSIKVYLPPSYSTGEKAYPVVYFLHGYGDSINNFMRTYKSKFDEVFREDGTKEFILVALDGNTKTGGSFYVNSEVCGNWEDYVTKELVTYIDENYRTIADKNSRGISGYSMGGFGALYLSLKNPDIFSSTLVFCPGVFKETDLSMVLDSWKGSPDVNKSYAQAFSPNAADTENYGNIIETSDINERNQVWEDWMNGYSNWNQKIADYLAIGEPLKSVMITYSDADSYTWIPGGCEDLINLLDKNAIPYQSAKFIDGHNIPYDAAKEYFVPFFGENLSYE